MQKSKNQLVFPLCDPPDPHKPPAQGVKILPGEVELQQALTLVKANGYLVSKPKAKATTPKFNALGLPMSSSFDPNYRIKQKRTPISRLSAPQRKFKWVKG